jgi:hypothetical protein
MELNWFIMYICFHGYIYALILYGQPYLHCVMLYITEVESILYVKNF